LRIVLPLMVAQPLDPSAFCHALMQGTPEMA
jgi:hypothetical protein